MTKKNSCLHLCFILHTASQLVLMLLKKSMISISSAIFLFFQQSSRYNITAVFHDNPLPEKTPLIASLAEEGRQQSILLEVLQAALQPKPLNEKIDAILEYLLSLEHLQFAAKAALFFVAPDRVSLTRKAGIGFSPLQGSACSTIPFGFCHCGQTAEKNTTTFCNKPPPLLQNHTAPPLLPGTYAGNYCVPITKDGRLLGLFTIYVSLAHHPSQHMYQLLEAVAQILAILLENRQMKQQLLQLISDLRRSNASVEEEKKFSTSLIEGLHHGLLVVNLAGRVQRSNAIAQTVLQPMNKNIDGELLADIIGKEASDQLLRIVPPDTDQFERELVFTTPTGENKALGFSTVSQQDTAGKNIGVIISLADISEVKYVRREMEKMNRLATIAEIASAVAHEVRNPLAGIKIMAQSIEEEAQDNSEQLECAQRIGRQVDRLNVLLSDFFAYARPAEPQKRAVSLADIIIETKPLINSRLSKNHIDLHMDISSELPLVIADPHQLQQVFLNLFLNAIDAIKQQGRIDISAERPTTKQLQHYKKKYPLLRQDAPCLLVHFTDNGTGMSPTTAEKVFEPFFTTKTSGAGLGLSIVYRTLKENDGGIVIASEEGKGTTFTMFLQAESQ